MHPLALQLYSLRREAEQNAEEVVLQVPGLGYGAVELADDYGWSIEKWKEMLGRTNLKVISTFAMLFEFEAKFDQLVELGRQIGSSRLVVPWLEEKWRNPEGFLEIARQLNFWAPKVREAGLTLYYHNHDFEFVKLADGSIGYDILLNNTHPALLRFEVDTYWIEKSGRDSVEFIQKYASRISAIHAKDLRASDKTDCGPGQGVIRFEEIVPIALKNNWPIVVEYEGENAVEVVRDSAAHLSKIISSASQA